MRRKRAVGLLMLCLLCAAVMAGRTAAEKWKEYKKIPAPYESKVMGVPVVSDISFLENRIGKESAVNPGVCYEGVLLPYDEAGVLYLSQGIDEEWMGRLSLEEEEQEAYCLVMFQDPYLEKKRDAMRENHAFTLWMVGEDSYYELHLAVSGMPVLSIQEERFEEQPEIAYEVDPDKKYFDSETRYYGTMEVFNPGVNTDFYEILQSRVCYHEKGGMTSSYEKKSYSLSVQDYQEQKVNVSLLGMRSDNTWKLNSLVTDSSRIREITASRIWKQFDEANETVDEPGPRMEYVELVLNNQYQGIYCLVEPVDEKKLSLEENDVLYKIIGNSVPPDEDIQEIVDNKWKICDSIRVRYPKTITDYSAVWRPFRDYLDIFYREEEIDYREALDKVDVSNLSDNFMFLMAASISDNYFKNSYYAARMQESGQYRIYRYPWDLDLSFGNIFDISSNNNVWFDEDYKVVYEIEELFGLREVDLGEVGSLFWEQWKEYRESFLETENILDQLVENRDYLIDTGAARREEERWPEENVDMDIDYLLDYQTKRMEWLDSYFEEWCQ